MKIFAFVARATTLAQHTLNSQLFGQVGEWKLADVLKEPGASLAVLMGPSKAEVAKVKAELASVAAASDGRLLRQLTMSDVGT